jgi:hypothetical protein
VPVLTICRRAFLTAPPLPPRFPRARAGPLQALGTATPQQEQQRAAAAAAADPEEERKRKRSTQVLESAAEETSSTQTDKFCAYYCFACGSFCMAVEGLLHTMPKRKTDFATAVPRKSAIKMRAKEGECKTIQREKGVEKQFRMTCESCGVPICYQNKAFSTDPTVS